MSQTQKHVHIIGGGMAGTEAAWQLLKADIPVILHEMRPHQKTDAHTTENLAEMVCSNSLRSDDHHYNAVGLCHYEMREMGSIIMAAAEASRVPAGGALAVDRQHFSAFISKTLESHPLFTLDRIEIDTIPPAHWENVIVATGPLTSAKFSKALQKLTGDSYLSFFDAISPIIHRHSIDMTKAWFQSRYDKGDGLDYINCPMNKSQYVAFIDALLHGKTIAFKQWEKDTPYFEGCLPIEVMAKRGPETLRFGPMKPVGLSNPHWDNQRCHAVVQLRQDNKLATLWNIVGFQTKLTYGAQIEIFKKIPGLEQAEFARLGGIHRNIFLNSPKLLDPTLRLKADKRMRFAGQITGVEGYVESAATGMLAGLFVQRDLAGKKIILPPETTALGALIAHITNNAEATTFQPMNVNFGLMPPPVQYGDSPRKLKGRDRKLAMTERAKADFHHWKKALE